MYPTTTILTKLQLPGKALIGQTALITGAARGIGEQLAYSLAALGAQVVIADRSAEGQAVAAAIQAKGGQARFVLCDLSSVDEAIELTQQANAAFGKIDILVNNAMIAPVAPVLELTLADWEQTFSTNLRAAFLTIKHLLPEMLQRRQGVIINMIAYEGSPLTAAYAATKMGLRSLALTVAREVGPAAGVSVFSFLPGLVETPGLREDLFPKLSARLGITTEELITQVATNNPGYPGLVPSEHCAAALAYAIVHAAEYHGQVADPFEPLSRFGITAAVIPSARLEPPTLEMEASLPEHLKTYITEVAETNRVLEQRIQIRTQELATAHQQSETLLLNILPKLIAERLKGGESTIADHFDTVTVLFADIVNFTPLSAQLPPDRLVQVLDAIFSAFDNVAQKHGLEKIKTIGDCYMLVGGLPERQVDHIVNVAHAALDIRERLDELGQELGLPLSARIGIHCGEAVAGVIGKKKFIYDLWGDTVNTASRMESHGVANHIQCTQEVYIQLREGFNFEPRGEIDIKGKGLMQTYFLTGLKQPEKPKGN